jgi:hypothetical protein
MNSYLSEAVIKSLAFAQNHGSGCDASYSSYGACEELQYWIVLLLNEKTPAFAYFRLPGLFHCT